MVRGSRGMVKGKFLVIGGSWFVARGSWFDKRIKVKGERLKIRVWQIHVLSDSSGGRRFFSCSINVGISSITVL